MSTWLITHPVFLEHDTGDGHPERPARLRAILDALDSPAFAPLVRREAEAATLDELIRVHSRGYVEETLAAIPEEGLRSLDPDTVISPASGDAALHAAGAVRQGVDAVMTGDATRVFCAVRPPGHHAEPDRAMGFCLFNNVAVGALHAQRMHGAYHVAVVDFDVHHGNGTQAMLGKRDGFLYASTHQSPLFPGTGRRLENSPGRLYNVPLGFGTDSAAFREAFHNEIVDALIQFDPDLILISAGFDAHYSDPLAGLSLTEEDFAWATREVASVADYCCQGRIVSTLEGGYDLDALAACATAHVTELMR
ncbi:MAG TPA: histone deacetylase family protein [Gammaproteobacteria bacterium]|nr:histone deacetylase family protein [Gammaproteobacteria bacterium]